MAFALAERVQMQTAMLATHLAFEIDDGAGLVRHEGAQEVLHLHLTDEADALAVFFLGRFESEFASEITQLRLQQMADGKVRDLDLLRPHHGEEVGLVFVRIGTAEDVTSFFACVVPGGDAFEAVVARPVPQHAEFHLAIAHHIRIGRDAGLVAFEEVFHDLLAVFGHEIDDAKRDAELLGDSAGILDVLLPRAMADDVLLVDPILHVHAMHLVSGTNEDRSCHAAVHSA